MSDFKVKSAVPLIPVEITLEQDGKETVILAHVDMMGKKLHLKHDDDFQIAEMEKQVFGILIKPLPPVDIPEKAMSQFKHAQEIKPSEQALEAVEKIKNERK